MRDGLQMNLGPGAPVTLRDAQPYDAFLMTEDLSLRTAFTQPFDPSGGDVLGFALNERRAGRPAVIVTLVAIDGASPRSPGAQMAIAEDGRFAGSISSGCLERAIVEEARAATARGEGGVVRYGKGSQFLDVVLPCGSGVDLLFTVNPSIEALGAALEALSERRPAALEFHPEGVRPAKAAANDCNDEAFVRAYQPPLRIVAAGVGAEVILLSQIARAGGYLVCAVSPDEKALAQCLANQTVRLQSASSTPDLGLDPWTAVVFLFHDRDWELSLLPPALASTAFYIGAVGSRKTHAARLDALRERGVSEQALRRIAGPIGLIPATRDPSALAVSVLAGVLAEWPY